MGLEGEGFPVHRAFAGVPLEVLDPFIHMDQMGEVEYAAGEPKGTPWHPHRGFETFTYLIDGRFIHQDSNGGGGTIDDGGTQYMTAGDGILHIETPPADLVESGGLFHGLQLWINLPRAKKRIAPQYQDLQGADLTMLTSTDGGALVRVLAGSVDGHAGPGISHTPLAITHITLAPGAQLVLPWPAEFNALAYALSGTGTVGAERRPFRGGQLAVLGAGGSVVLQADATQESRSRTSRCSSSAACRCGSRSRPTARSSCAPRRSWSRRSRTTRPASSASSPRTRSSRTASSAHGSAALLAVRVEVEVVAPQADPAVAHLEDRRDRDLDPAPVHEESVGALVHDGGAVAHLTVHDPVAPPARPA